MSKVNSYITNYTSKSYGNLEGDIIIDCSLGVNPELIPDSAFNVIKELDNDVIKKYPHEHIFEKVIIERYKNIANLTDENICLGNGSADLLYSHLLLYAGRGETILGHAPQFTAYLDIVAAVGATYKACPFKYEDGIALDFDEFESYARKIKPKIICLENPNNPTGKVNSIKKVEQMAKVAQEIGAALVVDEAYGDYIPDEDSAISLVEKYNNITVVRTLSKGYGLAGLKIGYAISQKEVITQLCKVQLPFAINSIGRRLAAKIMSDGDFLNRTRSKTVKSSKKFYEALKEEGMEKYRIAASDECTPIKLIYVDNEDIDLAKVFMNYGIASVSCATFDNLNKNAVRVLIPEEKKIDILIDLMKKASIEM